MIAYYNEILNIKLFFIDLEVTGLTPGKEYLFRVSAVNAEGESKPLEAEQAIVAKNPFGILIKNYSLNQLNAKHIYINITASANYRNIFQFEGIYRNILN